MVIIVKFFILFFFFRSSYAVETAHMSPKFDENDLRNNPNFEPKSVKKDKEKVVVAENGGGAETENKKGPLSRVVGDMLIRTDRREGSLIV